MEPNRYFHFDPAAFTPQQHEVLDLLAEGTSLTSAAYTHGITRATFYSWCRLTPSFRTAALSAREHACARRREDLLDAAHCAIQYLRHTLNNESAPHSVRTRIAFGLLNLRVTNGTILEAALLGQAHYFLMPESIHKLADPKLRRQAENSLAGVNSRRNERHDEFDLPHYTGDGANSTPDCAPACTCGAASKLQLAPAESPSAADLRD